MFIYFERLLDSPLAVVPASLVLCGLLVMPAVAVQEPEDPEEFECPQPTDPGDEEAYEAARKKVCDHARDVGLLHGEHHGGVACCGGILYPCGFPELFFEEHPEVIPDGVTLTEECLNDILSCLLHHEQTHIDDPFHTCNPDTPDDVHLGGFLTTGSDAEDACIVQAVECYAWVEEMDCYNGLMANGESQCPDELLLSMIGFMVALAELQFNCPWDDPDQQNPTSCDEITPEDCDWQSYVPYTPGLTAGEYNMPSRECCCCPNQSGNGDGGPGRPFKAYCWEQLMDPDFCEEEPEEPDKE